MLLLSKEAPSAPVFLGCDNWNKYGTSIPGGGGGGGGGGGLPHTHTHTVSHTHTHTHSHISCCPILVCPLSVGYLVEFL